MLRTSLIALCATASPQLCVAQVRLGVPFGEHMVLQRGMPVRVWGTASRGEPVAVRFRGAVRSTVADSQGRWEVSLPSTRAGGPFPLDVTAPSGGIALRNVMVGDVWVCAGQSNMQWPLGLTDNGANAIRTAGRWGLRLRRTGFDWAVSSPATSPSFSAVGFYFGRALAQRLRVPIGLIEQTLGGQRIAVWHPGGVIYRTIIAPTVGFAIRGVIWYQGESDAFALADADSHEDGLRKLVIDWRRVWGQGDFPFLWVQLARFRDAPGRGWMRVQEAQRLALDVPRTAMVSILDLPAASIHDTRKLPVAERLAVAARAVAYGEPLVHMGPTLNAAATKIRGREVRLAFDNVGGGLRSSAGALREFEIAGSDLRFVAADARIAGGEVVVSSPSVASPIAVRHAWSFYPDANLINAEGLPASPFRFLAHFEPFGVGCGRRPGPVLSASGVPRIGRSFRLDLSRLPGDQPGVVMLGVSRTVFGPVRLPVDMSPLGMPGCLAYVSGDAELAFGATIAGTASLGFRIPRRASLLAAALYPQGFVLDPGVNPAGVSSTNAGVLRVGY